MKRTILLCLVYLCNADVSANNAGLSHLTVREGLPSGIIYSAMQDSRGFMWFCTETGVSRYDGWKFENFTIADGLADNEIFKCFEDSRHRIWFLSYNGRLSYYADGMLHNSINTPSLSYRVSGAFLLRCVEDKSQTLWFSTSLGSLVKVTDTSVNHIRPLFGERYQGDFSITSALFTADGNAKTFVEDPATGAIFVEDLSTGGITGGKVSRPSPRPLLNRNPKDKLFLYEGGLAGYDNGTLYTYELKKAGGKSRLLAFLEDSNFLWLAFETEGVLRIDIRTGRTDMHLLDKQLITGIVKDSEHNLWFVSYDNGVYVLKHNSRCVTNYATGVTFAVAGFRRASAHYIFAGSSDGRVQVFCNGRKKNSFRLSPKKFNRVLDIIPANGQVLIGCDEGIYRYEAGTAEAPVRLSCIAGYKNYNTSSDGSIWACSQDNIVKIKDRDCSTINHTPRLIKYTALAFLPDSGYYLGSTNKLYRVHLPSDKADTVLNDDELRTQVSDLAMINGHLWVATHGNGIIILHNDKIVRHICTTREDLVSDICDRIYDDGRKYVWVATNNGISVLDRIGGDHICDISEDAGIIANGVKNISVDNGIVYAATNRGVSVFRLEDIALHTPPPAVYVTGFTRGNEKRADPRSNIAFDYFRGVVTLTFTAITYQVSHAKLQYQYKFADARDWHYTSVSDISLYSLPPGTHSLMFRAKKPDSDWSSPATVSIIVTPLWYQSAWFRGGLGILALATAYFLVRARLQAINKKAEAAREHLQQISELENKALAAQMNPHFIFNSLNTVQHLILSRDEHQSLNFLADFAILMRSMLEISRKPAITLAEEIDFLTRYLQLEAIRFNNAFAYHISIEDSLPQDEIKIPPALLQPLLENAIKHGIASLRGDGNILLLVSREGHFLVAVVEDNGVGIDAHARQPSAYKKRESAGLKVLKQRLSLIRTQTGECSTIRITDKAFVNPGGRGTRIEVRIPIQ